MKTLSYTKTFLTGTLAGLSVHCSYAVPASLLAERQAEVARFTRENPGSDCMTRDKFFVSEVR